MSENKVWSADELLAMSPNDRDEAVHAGLVTDVGAVPADLLAQARADIAADIAEQEAARPVVE